MSYNVLISLIRRRSPANPPTPRSPPVLFSERCRERSEGVASILIRARCETYPTVFGRYNLGYAG
jgi:hypothetical protein